MEIGDAVARLLGSLDAPSSDLLSTLFGRWPEVVGADVARHCRPEAVDGDRLVVVCDDPLWAGELRWLSDEILKRIAEKAGSDRLQSLTIRVVPGG